MQKKNIETCYGKLYAGATENCQEFPQLPTGCTWSPSLNITSPLYSNLQRDGRESNSLHKKTILIPRSTWRMKKYYCKKCLKRVSGYFQFSNFSIGLEPPLYMICRGSIQQQARWPKNGLYNTLLSKMCQLRPRKVRGLDALVAAVSPGEDRKKRDIRRIRLEVFLKKWS